TRPRTRVRSFGSSGGEEGEGGACRVRRRASRPASACCLRRRRTAYTWSHQLIGIFRLASKMLVSPNTPRSAIFWALALVRCVGSLPPGVSSRPFGSNQLIPRPAASSQPRRQARLGTNQLDALLYSPA